MGKIKVLHLLGGGSEIGGIERVLLNYCAHMNLNRFQFSFCFYRESTFPLLSEQYSELLKSVDIIELHCFQGKSSLKGYLKSIPRVARIVANGDYDIVHIHAGRPALLVCGLLSSIAARAKIRIVHSHSTLPPKQNMAFPWLNELRIWLVSTFLIAGSHYQFACSEAAASYMFGGKAVIEKRVQILPNAIELEQFAFNTERRNEIRNEFSIKENTPVIGHIGRFSPPKNHHFLFKVFQKIVLQSPECKFWLLGDGPLKNQIKIEAEKAGLSKNITFWGERKNVSTFLLGMDLMIFPSLYEGLSVTLVEAQATGLPVLASDNLSPEHMLTSKIEFFPLKKGEQAWADEAMRILSGQEKRQDMVIEVRNRGYDIIQEAQKLEEFYEEAIRK